jgi:hypothetical protein
MKTVKLLSWHDDIKTKAASLKHRDLLIDAAPLISTSGLVGELARPQSSRIDMRFGQAPLQVA